MSIIKQTLKLFFLFCFVIIFSIPTSASCVSWYCKRTKDHSQPTLGNDLKFTEKYNVFWCDTNLKDDEKVIYLTFDAGYENGNVQKIVDVLKEENVTGAFFILDNLLINNEALVRKMIENGNIVANHTAKHKDITTFNDKDELYSELTKLEKLYRDKFGEEMQKFFRPPEGKINKKSLEWLNELGYKTIMWSFAYEDWDNSSQLSNINAKKKILENIHNGEVMLLHPTSKTNAAILKDIIRELKSQGYRFGTLNELCEKDS